ncbi:MAG: hypothetical protein M1832_006097 [Thelocarpon impressellum]|nr:MAG: hypothetical protein M1832_006097 [Thelocarpon impressellum]
MAETALPRNALLREAAGTLLGGLWQQGSFTKSDSISTAAIVLVAPPSAEYGIFPVRDGDLTGDLLRADELPPQCGDYVVMSEGESPF